MEENGIPELNGIPTCGLRREPSRAEHGQRQALCRDVVQLIEHIAWRSQVVDAARVVEDPVVKTGNRHGANHCLCTAAQRA